MTYEPKPNTAHLTPFSLIVLYFVVLTASCASVPPDNAPAIIALRAEIAKTLPNCSAGEDCNLKWSAAKSWLLMHSDMKVRQSDADYIETYRPTPYRNLFGGSIIKRARRDGKYDIVYIPSCSSDHAPFGIKCKTLGLQKTIDFNKHISEFGTTHTKK